MGEVTTVNCVDEDTDGVCDQCGGIVVEPYKAAAKAELATYTDAAAYREAQQAELEAAINKGNDEIDAAANKEEVATALAAAKTAIDAIKTDAQLTAEELAAAKEAAKAELATYTDAADYREAQQAELEAAINDGNQNIDTATSTDAVTTALANAKAAIDAIKTDAQMTADELADAKEAAKAELATYTDAADYREAQQAELEAAINEGSDEIDAAATIDNVTAALNSAKKAIDMIKTDAQLTAEEQLAAAKETLAGAIETAREYCDSIKDDYPVIADDLDTRLQQAEGVLANADATTDEINTMTELVETALEAAKDAQKEADEAAEQPTEQPDKEPNKPCPVCGGLHNGNLIDNFRSLILHFIHILNHIMKDSVRIAGNVVSDAT